MDIVYGKIKECPFSFDSPIEKWYVGTHLIAKLFNRDDLWLVAQNSTKKLLKCQKYCFIPGFKSDILFATTGSTTKMYALRDNNLVFLMNIGERVVSVGHFATENMVVVLEGKRLICYEIEEGVTRRRPLLLFNIPTESKFSVFGRYCMLWTKEHIYRIDLMKEYGKKNTDSISLTVLNPPMDRFSVIVSVLQNFAVSRCSKKIQVYNATGTVIFTQNAPQDTFSIPKNMLGNACAFFIDNILFYVEKGMIASIPVPYKFKHLLVVIDDMPLFYENGTLKNVDVLTGASDNGIVLASKPSYIVYEITKKSATITTIESFTRDPYYFYMATWNQKTNNETISQYPPFVYLNDHSTMVWLVSDQYNPIFRLHRLNCGGLGEMEKEYTLETLTQVTNTLRLPIWKKTGFWVALNIGNTISIMDAYDGVIVKQINLPNTSVCLASFSHYGHGNFWIGLCDRNCVDIRDIYHISLEGNVTSFSANLKMIPNVPLLFCNKIGVLFVFSKTLKKTALFYPPTFTSTAYAKTILGTLSLYQKGEKVMALTVENQNTYTVNMVDIFGDLHPFKTVKIEKTVGNLIHFFYGDRKALLIGTNGYALIDLDRGGDVIFPVISDKLKEDTFIYSFSDRDVDIHTDIILANSRFMWKADDPSIMYRNIIGSSQNNYNAMLSPYLIATGTVTKVSPRSETYIASVMSLTF